jgi:hypothetical protein
MPKKKRWTDRMLVSLVESQVTMAGVLRGLGLRPIGGNYVSVKKHIRRLGLDTSHWLGRSWSKGQSKPFPTGTKPLSEVLVAGRATSSSHLRRRLIREGVLKEECAICALSSWLGKSITLHLDHINGDRFDNRLQNIRLLCPNCHSQTDTYCGKNSRGVPRKKAPKKRPQANTPAPTCSCGEQVSKRGRLCPSCAQRRRTKIIWPPVEELRDRVAQTSYSAVSRELGVSDNAVRKRIHNHG